MDEEIYERVLEIGDEEPMDPSAAGVEGPQLAASGGGLSAEAWKTLRALNQTTVRREWELLKQAAASPASAPSRASGGVACGTRPPLVEDGALLLVRFYLSGEGLRAPLQSAADVEAELSAMGERLAARLPDGYDAVLAVRTLGQMLFDEEGYHGNQQNYYDYRNSLLDHVLQSHMGIPISLSVVFAAICHRVGVALDMIGLPGHFLLATRPTSAHEPRVFVDTFHG
eukprot:1713642-Prymnesium_polylepis.1